MLKEAFESMFAQAQKMAPPVVVQECEDYRDVLINGSLVAVKTPPGPRDHQATTLQSFTDYCEDWGNTEGVDNPVVWIGEYEIVGVLDDKGHRANEVTLTLVRSPEYETLASSARGQFMDQRSFVRLLRIDLAKAIQPVDLLEKVKRVKFGSDVTITSQSSRTRESMGREINEKCESLDGEIPETVTATFPVYSTPGMDQVVSIQCSVEIDMAAGSFRLLPMPGELDRITKWTLASAENFLNQALSDCKVYRGTP